MSKRRKNREELVEKAVRSPAVLAHLRAASPGVGVASGEASGDDRAIADALLEAFDELYVFDLSGRIVDANALACRQLGYERAQLLGMSIADISLRQTALAFERLVAALRDEGPQYLYGHNRRSDGSSYPIEARLWLAPFRDEEHVYALLRDAHGYQGLIEERDQMISLIENSSEAITVASPEGACSYMNPAALKALGFERVEDVAGRSLWELHSQGQQAVIRDEILPAARRGRWRGELVYENRGDGAAVPCSVNAFGIRHSQSGDLLGVAVVAHDISRRKEAERHRERLLALNEVSREAATSLLEGEDLNRAVEIILSGVSRVLDVSRSFLCRYREDRRKVFRTHGWDSEQERVQRLEPDPEPAEPYAWATDVLVRGDVIRIPDVAESGLISREGSGVLRPDVRALLVMPVVVQGRLESFFGFVDTRRSREWEGEEFAILQIIVDSFARAIERRKAERERELIAHALERAVEREQLANRYKSEFLASMSHELRTPMNAIVGYAELLSRRNVEDENRETWVTNIRRSTDYLLSLINNVLDLSKIEAGEMRIESEPVAIAEAIASVEELLRGQAEEKLLSLDVVYDGPVPELVDTDAVRFKQILVNLVANAIKFTSEGGVTLRVGTRNDPGSDEGTLVIEVVDTGIGIGEEDMERIFRPFSQVHAGRESRRGSTGLGLDISRRLTRLMGGELLVESRPGAGSTFTLKLPLRGASVETLSSPPRRDEKTSAPAVSLGGRRVLIVDDHLDNREVLRFLLTEAGCAVDSAENGALGVKLALAAARSGEAYDVILMDMSMPVMDGYEATRLIVEAGVETPVVALTALAMQGDEERCREVGCVDYVSKPVVPSAFLTTVARHLPARAVEDQAGTSDEAAAPALSLVGNPRFEPLIRRYVASFVELADQLREHFEQGRLDELRTRAHRLRGTAANYGYPELSRVAGVCEDRIREEADRADVGRALTALERLLRQISERDGSD